MLSFINGSVVFKILCFLFLSASSPPVDSAADSKDKPSSSSEEAASEVDVSAATAKSEVDRKAEEEVIQKKIEKLSGHMFAVM